MRQVLWPIMILLVGGCSAGTDSPDLSQQVLEQQADQQQELVRQSRELASGSRELVEADAQARRELAELHGSLAEQQREIGRQRDVLEQERRDLAQARHRAPLVAAAVQQTGLVLACLLPLLIAALALWQLHRSGEEDMLLNELLIQELAAPSSRLLPADPPALEAPPDAEVAELPF